MIYKSDSQKLLDTATISVHSHHRRWDLQNLGFCSTPEHQVFQSQEKDDFEFCSAFAETGELCWLKLRHGKNRSSNIPGPNRIGVIVSTLIIIAAGDIGMKELGCLLRHAVTKLKMTRRHGCHFCFLLTVWVKNSSDYVGEFPANRKYRIVQMVRYR